MNIKQAKDEIKNTVKAYLKKDARGEYVIPHLRQRPMLLMGPPGIGKTQIMEQIARECRIGLVAYTITHHTRQSAVGLPYIREEEFGGKKYSVTEYTMSEIIASVYKKIKDTGLTEGILFIDEINCVSETLSPMMLQFLQCKTFGNQAVPHGWIIVAAGNPPEYNKSVRDFDMVTLDRVRYLEVEADYRVWKEYARQAHISNAILSYLEIRPGNFYRVEADIDGMQFVTARGWEDLSELMKVYDELGLDVDETVAREFLHHAAVAEDAASYFELYKKYRDDYGIAKILDGETTPDIFERIYKAAFDERLSVVNLLLDGLSVHFSRYLENKNLTDLWYDFLKNYRAGINDAQTPAEAASLYSGMAAELSEAERANIADSFYTRDEEALRERLITVIKENAPDIHALDGNMPHDSSTDNSASQTDPSQGVGNIQQVFEQTRRGFEEQRALLDSIGTETIKHVENAFDFMEQAFAAGEEMLVFVTELTLTPEAAVFLSDYTIDRYMTYNEKLLVGTRRAELLSEIRRD